MVRFARCFPHAMGSPPRRGSRGGDVAITSPFFASQASCFADLSPPERLLLPIALLIWIANLSFDCTTSFDIVTYSRIRQTTWPPLLSIQCW